MIADLVTGHSWGADVCWLLAVIAAGLAAVLVLASNRPRRGIDHPADGTLSPVLREYVWAPVLGWAALALTALGLLLL